MTTNDRDKDNRPEEEDLAEDLGLNAHSQRSHVVGRQVDLETGEESDVDSYDTEIVLPNTFWDAARMRQRERQGRRRRQGDEL